MKKWIKGLRIALDRLCVVATLDMSVRWVLDVINKEESIGEKNSPMSSALPQIVFEGFYGR